MWWRCPSRSWPEGKGKLRFGITCPPNNILSWTGGTLLVQSLTDMRPGLFLFGAVFLLCEAHVVRVYGHLSLG